LTLGVAVTDEADVRRWHSACGESGDCVEVSFEDDSVLVRGSRDRSGSMLTFTRAEWRAFCAAIAAGELLG
jgi:hypothetical protein